MQLPGTFQDQRNGAASAWGHCRERILRTAGSAAPIRHNEVKDILSKSKAAISWSGGKDSYLALHKLRDDLETTTLLTMFTEDGTRSCSHGLRPEVLEAQASALSLELVTGRASWKTYEREFVATLESLHERGIEYVAFGDIFLEAHREWAERVCESVGLEALEPLWNASTTNLINEFLRLGGRARIVAVDQAKLDESWLARSLDTETIERFRSLGLDPCGEHGEYHTVVEWAPGFAHSIQLLDAGRYDFSGYAAVDMSLACPQFPTR